MKTWHDKWIGWKISHSDGCTAAPNFNFRKCCEEHDFYYQKHNKDTGVSRKEADKILRLCIKQHGWPRLCWVYWCVARSFGWFFWSKS